MQEYKMTLKDEDGQVYDYNYHDFQWTEGNPLLIFKHVGISNDGGRQMEMIAKFQNCRAILEIVEVEDEIEG